MVISNKNKNAHTINVEIVEFYPTKQDKAKGILKGSMHVYLCDLQVDLRGIHVMKKKNFWKFHLPSAKGINDEGNEVWYPCFSFMDREKTAALIQAIREKGIPFIKEKLVEAIS